MMYINGSSSGLFFFAGLHIVSMLTFSIGVLFLLFFAYKKLSTHALWKWGWILVVVGVVITIATAPLMFRSGLMGYGMGFRHQPFNMMGDWNSAVVGGSNDEQAQEEAEGKVLFDKVASKEMTCADLSDDDFELIGEYVMGQRFGNNHEQMNTRLKLMMGDDGEVRMHIALGKSATNCDVR